MPTKPNSHLVDQLLEALGYDAAAVRRCQFLPRPARHLADAEAIAAALEPHLIIFREMVGAGEAAGWDIDNSEILNAGRAAVLALLGSQE
ncbi:hypothetical protein RA307_04890 [Xanthobacteraceae bacterium Astr-EGSB]|uniref:hypothetical protein n=1 Tax=Astrobacterium formosum TaxID=3069710 RepID=UPI0027ADD299|nr:hypothetical protein [Xanthobacteraceae bacterium Astr-EGSB]